MSIDSFDGDGFTDQPSIIYAFETDDSGNVQLRELARSGFGEVGPSPGDVIEREITTSDPTDSLPEPELTGQGGLHRTIAVRTFWRLPALGTVLKTQQAVANRFMWGKPVQTQPASEIIN